MGKALFPIIEKPWANEKINAKVKGLILPTAAQKKASQSILLSPPQRSIDASEALRHVLQADQERKQRSESANRKKRTVTYTPPRAPWVEAKEAMIPEQPSQTTNYIMKNWKRWQALANRSDVLTEEEKSEAKHAYETLNKGSLELRGFWLQGSGHDKHIANNYDTIAAVLKNKSSLSSALGAGLLSGIPLVNRAAEELGKRSPKEETLKSMGLSSDVISTVKKTDTMRDAIKQNPTAAGAAEVAANVGLLLGTGGLVKGATEGVRWMSKLPSWVRGAINSAITFGTLETADAISEVQTKAQWDEEQSAQKRVATQMGGNYEEKEYHAGEQVGNVLKRAGIGLAGGFAGGAASAGTGAALQKLLGKWAGNSIVRAAAAGVSGAAFAGGDSSVKELAKALEYGDEYTPDTQQIVKDLAVAFAFGSITALLSGGSRIEKQKGLVQGGDTQKPKENYFRGVSDLDDLKTRFRDLAKQYHPDVGGSNQAFAEISEEYTALKNWMLQERVSTAASAYKESRVKAQKGETATAEHGVMVKSVKDIQDAISDGTISGEKAGEIYEVLNDLVAQKNTATSDVDGVGTKYSISERFASEFDAWDQSTTADEKRVSHGYLKVGRTSEPLKRIGVRDGSVYWRKSKIGEILQTHPEIDTETAKSVPQILENPIIAIKSKTREDSIVLFGDVKGKDGRSVMAALALTPKAGGNMEAEFSLLTSAYGRDQSNIKSLVETSELLYLDPNKDRTDTLLMQIRVQFPSRQQAYGPIGTISYAGSDVKIRGKTLQQLLQGNSKQNFSKNLVRGNISKPYDLAKLGAHGSQTLREITQSVLYGKHAMQLKTADELARLERAKRARSETERTGILAQATEEIIQSAERIATATGTPILFYEQEGGPDGLVEGFYQNGRLYLNTRGKHPIARVAAHELTHHVEDAAGYGSMKQEILAFMKQRGEDLETLRQNKRAMYGKNGEDLSDEDVDRELVAEFVADRLFVDEDSILELARKDRNLAQRILDWIKSMLKKVFGTKEERFYQNLKQKYQSALDEVNRNPSLDEGARKNSIVPFAGTEGKSPYELENVKEMMLEAGEDIPETSEEDFGFARRMRSKGVSYSKTLAQNLDEASGRDPELREKLRDVIERPILRAKGAYARSIKQNLDELYAVAKENGIRAGSKESAAVQWIGEGQRQDPYGNPQAYTEENLKRDFPNNWRQIKAVEKKVRGIYDAYVDRINESLTSIYPDTLERAQGKAVEYRAAQTYYQERVQIQKDLLRGIEKLIGEKRAALAQKKDGTKAKADLENSILYQERRAKTTREAMDRYLTRESAAKKNAEKTEQEIQTGAVLRNKRLLPRTDYFHHFQEMENGFSGIVNLVSTPSDIDARLSGESEFTKPNTRWAGFLQPRGRGAYTEDAIGGLMRYIPVAEYKVHMDPVIANGRAQIKALADATEDTKNANHFLVWYTDYINDLAGKTNPLDRPLQKVFGRKGLQVIGWLNNRVKKNAVMGNLRSAVAQVFNLPNAMAYVKNPVDWGKGARLYGKSLIRNANAQEVLAQSDFMRERYLDSAIAQFEEGLLKKPVKFASWLMQVGDEQMTKLIWSAAYEQGVRTNQKTPVEFADDITRRAVAGRGVGEVPLMQKSKFTQLVAPFQVEVNNAWQILKERGKEKDLYGLFAIMITSWLMNAVTKELFGFDVSFDPINALVEGIEDWDEEKGAFQNVADVAGRLGGEVLSNVPFGTQITDYVISNEADRQKLFGDSDPTRFGTGNIGANMLLDPIIKGITGEDFSDAALSAGLNVALPFAGKQTERLIHGGQDLGVLPRIGLSTKDGFQMQGQEGGASYSASGRLRFPIDARDTANVLRELAFGPFSTAEGKQYIKNGSLPLSINQTGLYRKLTELGTGGGAAYKTILEIGRAQSAEEKKDVLDRLELSREQKIFLYKEVIAGKKEREMMDAMQAADADLQEVYDALRDDDRVSAFAYSTLSDDEKLVALEFVMGEAEYRKLEDATGVGIAIEDYMDYMSATEAMKADKASNGKTIPGSKKKKVLNYINTMGISNKQKNFLYRMEGYSEKTIYETPWNSGVKGGRPLVLPTAGQLRR